MSEYNDTTKPTRGPWIVETHATKYPDLFTHSIVAPKGWQEGPNSFKRCGIASGLDSLPDAQLMAAAPILLRELKSLSDRLANYAKFPKREQEIYIENARAAIAKAEGRA